MTERWLPVVGYEGWYEVSDQGRVRRIKAGRGAQAGYILQPARMQIGYHMVTLSKNSAKHRERKYVHDLVAAAFLGPRPTPKHQVNHMDGDKGRSCLENLEYVTRKGNAEHARRLGLVPFGERNGHAKLSEDDVREMRRLRPSMSYYRLARKFGVSYAAAWNAVNGKTWAHLPVLPGPPISA